ncbi:uncharacterized protein LOC143464779 [Clavelina lepadiformis]|uniref:uncharacterized protein LOC143464779 n=1 Tax=Clavelina lepadiformis TaxID=159417 RepID=UPI0040414B04
MCIAGVITKQAQISRGICRNCRFETCFSSKHSFIRLTPSQSSCFLLSYSSYSNWGSEKLKQLQDVTHKNWSNFYEKYEEFVGLKDVQDAQAEVRKAEKKFLQARHEERAVLREVSTIRDQLKNVRERLSHVNYSSPLYPQLANEQHELVTKEEQIKIKIDSVEEKERDTFLELSAAMRDSYEKERARVERTKNWSLIGTVVGTVLGMLGSAYINRVRTKDLQHMIKEKDQNEEIKTKIGEVLPNMQSQYDDIKEEIKQLQVCLVNKLLSEPIPAKATASSMVNDESLNADATTKLSEIVTVLNSFKQVLQSFQNQLLQLLEDASLNHELLTEQNEQLGELIKSIDVMSNSNESSPYVESKIDKQLSIINSKLDQICQAFPYIDNNITGAPLKSMKLETVTRKEKLSEDESTSSYRRPPVIDIILWGGVMMAIYHILRV